MTVDINKIQLPIEQDCSLGSYFVDGDVVYYSVYVPVGDYEENRMHNLMFQWKQKSNLLSGEETEIESRAGFFLSGCSSGEKHCARKMEMRYM